MTDTTDIPTTDKQPPDQGECLWISLQNRPCGGEVGRARQRIGHAQQRIGHARQRIGHAQQRMGRARQRIERVRTARIEQVAAPGSSGSAALDRGPAAAPVSTLSRARSSTSRRPKATQSACTFPSAPLDQQTPKRHSASEQKPERAPQPPDSQSPSGQPPRRSAHPNQRTPPGPLDHRVRARALRRRTRRLREWERV